MAIQRIKIFYPLLLCGYAFGWGPLRKFPGSYRGKTRYQIGTGFSWLLRTELVRLSPVVSMCCLLSPHILYYFQIEIFYFNLKDTA